MGLLERLLNRLFGCHPGAEVEDPELGAIRFDGIHWRADRPDGVSLGIWCSRHGLDARLRGALLDGLRQLPRLERRAREFFAAEACLSSWPETWPDARAVLRLISVDAHSVSKQEALQHASEFPAAAEAIVHGEPALWLQFEVAGQEDVLDVMFVESVPMSIDYH